MPCGSALAGRAGVAVLSRFPCIFHPRPTPACALRIARDRRAADKAAVGGAGTRAKPRALTWLPGPQLPRLSLMEPESEFRDIDNPPAEAERREAERRGSGAPPACPEPAPRPAPPRGSLRSARGLGAEERVDATALPRAAFPAVPREKPTRRVSDSFFRPSVMEPILGRAQYSQLRKKS